MASRSKSGIFMFLSIKYPFPIQSIVVKPTTVKLALGNRNWKQAIDIEFQAL